MPDAPHDLAHEARTRAEQLESFADELDGPRCHVLTETAKLLLEMASELKRLREALGREQEGE